MSADRLELAVATLTSLTANIHRDREHRAEPFTARDFMYEPPPGPLPEELESEAMLPENVKLTMEGFMRGQERRA